MQRPEQLIHKAVAEHLRLRGVPGLIWWHTPNGMYAGGRRNAKGMAIQGALMKGLGVRPGVSDIIAVYRGRVYALELKAEGGRISDSQREFLYDMERAGGHTAVAVGIDAALDTLSGWGLLRGSVH